MSVAAEQERSRRAVWAAPGGFHDKLIAVLKAVLPVVVGILTAFLATAPLTRHSEVSFVLDKGKVAVSPERIRLTQALYRGQDSKGQPFSLRAASGVQKHSDIPVVDMNDMSAQLMMDDGPATLTANQGRYNFKSQEVMIDGPVEFAGSNGGYKLATRDVAVDLNSRHMVSQGRVDGELPIGRFNAGHLEADLGTRVVALTGRPHLLITQNSRKGPK